MEYNRLIDHTLLAPDATREQIVKLCKEAEENHFASVCVNPCWITLSSRLLKGTDTKVCTVIGFPLGARTTEAKVFEAQDAVLKGAEEVDRVINIGKLKNKEDEYVYNEIRAIKSACDGKLLKVIIECCLLTDEEKVRACVLAKKAGADFVKTSTGFSKWGAKAEDVKLRRETVGPDRGVKAAGGIRDKKTAEERVKAGATRIGTSHGIEIVK